MDQTITSAQLRHRLAAEFGGSGGGARLARALGVSESTASKLRRGDPSMTLAKVAAYYGYEPAGEDTWAKSSRRIDPKDVGYRHRWTAIVIAELRELMEPPTRPRTSAVAKRLGVAPSTLRGVMARAHIRLRQEDRT